MKRQTVQRQVIMENFFSMKDHPTAEQVYQQIHTKYAAISKSTVYRVLQQAAEDGEIARVEVQNGPDRYDLRRSPHYHIRCSVCGRVDDVKADRLPDPMKFLDDAGGYDITGCSVMFSGVCSRCAGTGK